MAVTGRSGVWVQPQEAVPSVCVLVLLGTTTLLPLTVSDSFLEERPFWLVLVTSKDCLRVKGFKVEVRLRFRG